MAPSAPLPARSRPAALGRRAGVLGAIAVALAAAGALVATAVLGQAGPAAAAGPARFVEATATAGLDHAYDGEFRFFVGGGVAAFDCDDDGRPELYLAGGERRAALFRNDGTVGAELRFTRLPGEATDLDAVTGAYPLDLDGDARLDLVVLRYGENVILRGLGECRFERANEALGIDGGSDWTAAFSATWEPGAGLPTLAFANYLAIEADGQPSRDRCADSVLVRPDGSTGRYGAPIALAPGYCALSALFSDWGRSGRRDLRLSNDRHYYRDGSEQLWRVAPGEPPRPYTAEEGWATMRIWGMGIASHDITGDGYPEVFLTSQADNKLQTLDELRPSAGPDASGTADGDPAPVERPAYRDIALAAGATAHRPFIGGDVLPSTAWHAQFADVNNDTFADLFVAKGNVEAQPGYAAKDPSNLLLGRPDGTFVEAADAAGLLSFARARGAAVIDLDLDGFLDLVVVNRREPVRIWRNTGETVDRPELAGGAADVGRSIALRLRQDGPNRDAIGAWVDVRAGDRVLVHELTVGGGHASGQAGWLHVGIGQVGRAEVRVRWPDGGTGPWLAVDAGTFAVLERGPTADADRLTRWSPPG